LTAGTLNFDPVTWTVGNDFTSSNNNVRSLNLGSATINVDDDWTFTTTTNLTFSAGTSTINMTGTSTASFAGGGLTYNTVNFAPVGTGANQDISGANTFANVSFLAPTGSTSYNSYQIANNLVITGTLTATGVTAIRRIFLCSNTVSTTVTLTAGAVSLAHVDFRSITVAGAAVPATGTGLGDCGGNSGITFPAAKTVYWNLAGTQNWSATAWATTPTGSPDINNFPLAQDTAVFTDSGSASFVAIQAFNIGTVDASGRTTAMTLNYSGSSTFYGSHTWSSILSIAGTGGQTFSGRGTMTFTAAGKAIGFSVTVDCATGTFQLGDAFNSSSTITHTSGTFNTVNNNLTCSTFSSNNSNTRTLTLGTSTINLSGTSTVWTTSSTAGLTFSGASSTINLTNTYYNC
jgi:fibronectin-binding autotransporter adhesin